MGNDDYSKALSAAEKELADLDVKADVTLFAAFYNFCRVHSSLRVTPAMQAGLTDHVWSVSELLLVA